MVLLPTLVLACMKPMTPAPPASATDARDDASPHVPGVTDPALASVLASWMDRRPLAYPPDTLTPEERAAHYLSESAARVSNLEALKRETATLTTLSDHDELVRGRLAVEIDTALLRHACRSAEWSVDATAPLGRLFPDPGAPDTMNRLNLTPTIDRLDSEARWFPTREVLLRRALKDGLVATRRGIEEFVRETETLDPSKALAQLEDTERERLHSAFDRYQSARMTFTDFVNTEILGASTEVGAAPAECYRADILANTDRPWEPTELHAIGLAELESIETELAALGEVAFGESDLQEIRAHLRAPEFHFDSEESLLEAASAVAREGAEAAPAWISRSPGPCSVRPLEDVWRASWTPSGVYNRGTILLFTEPGAIRTWELRTLMFHECVPGHHVEQTVSGTTAGWPSFMHRNRSVAVVEGWAHYAEALAMEMGLFPEAIDRIGLMEHRAWRASRLVVDTGLHHYGWSRAQAEDFLFSHTALPPTVVENEVDRYLKRPGQALAYKVGELEIRRLRRQAEAELGDRFDIRAFHDAVLDCVGTPLGSLDLRIRQWIASQQEQGRLMPASGTPENEP